MALVVPQNIGGLDGPIGRAQFCPAGMKFFNIFETSFPEKLVKDFSILDIIPDCLRHS